MLREKRESLLERSREICVTDVRVKIAEGELGNSIGEEIENGIDS